MRGITRASGVKYSALVPNLRGCDRALSSKVDEINLVMSISDSHNRANLGMSCDASLVQLSEIVVRARREVNISVSLSTAFGCPYEGRVEPRRVLRFVREFTQIGVERISLCDTTGMANPIQVQELFLECRSAWPSVEFTAHFHNTRGMGLANVIAALEAGVDHFDSSLGGLGGCPFAVGATGNVCTEDLVHMLEAIGYQTAVDLDALLLIAADLPLIVGHEVPSQVLKAGPYSKVHPYPGKSDQNVKALKVS
jgi:hydroxymethylglutaryl-CoA lyase